jgi:phosphopantothenoylcysteine decarboxylase / phosphopantothenate---cysteine ligase
MHYIKGKKILLGISGGIAAYKAAFLVREWVRNGADVEIIMTQSAKEFITPLTFETLIGKKIHITLFPENEFSATVHIDLADWADVVIIAPATANTIAKICHGIGDDLLTTVCLAAYKKLVVAPAMNSNMWENPVVQQNVELLQKRGVVIIPPDSGDLACGYTGTGRLQDSWYINHWLSFKLEKTKNLKGKKVLITAGRTEEEIDPARIITNRSSAKMGFSLAVEAFYRGAKVVLISGPNALNIPPGVDYFQIKTAAEMLNSVQANWDKTDIFIAAAAVADYRPETQFDQKVKKESITNNIKLVANPDILATVSKKKGKCILVGFAVETENEKVNALKKLKAKNLDLIVVNNPKDNESAFGAETNKVTIINKKGEDKSLPLLDKDEVAKIIFDQLK